LDRNPVYLPTTLPPRTTVTAMSVASILGDPMSRNFPTRMSHEMAVGDERRTRGSGGVTEMLSAPPAEADDDASAHRERQLCALRRAERSYALGLFWTPAGGSPSSMHLVQKRQD
jgi:hypothetical protein